MKESYFAAAALTALLTGGAFAEHFANNWFVYIILIIAAVAGWIWFFRKPPAAGAQS